MPIAVTSSGAAAPPSSGLDTDWPLVLQQIGQGIYSPDHNLQSYDTLIHFWRAIAEKFKAFGNCAGVFPEGSTEWDGGLITNVELVSGDTRIRITCEHDDHTAFNWIDETDGDRKRWVNYTKPATAGFMPENYRFHADTRDADHNRMISADIVDNGDDWVEVANDGRWNLNRTLASYIGKAFGITGDKTLGCQRRHWKERIPPRPNAFEWDTGTVTQAMTSSVTDATDATDGGDLIYPKRWPEALKDANGNWRDALLKIDGKWTRVPITGVVLDAAYPTFTFAEQAVAPDIGSGYWIVDAGGWWRPELRLTIGSYVDRQGRKRYRRASAIQWNFWRWYHGVLRGYWSHDPAGDTIESTTFAADFVAGVILGLTSCEEVDVDVYDTDYKVEAIDECNECPDGFFAPDFWYGYRALQIAVELVCSAFTERKVYTTEPAIVPFTIATFHRKFVPENTREAVITSVGFTEVTDCVICGPDPDLGGCLTCITDSWANVAGWTGGALPLDPITVHWSIHDPDGTTVGEGWIGGASNKPAINGPGTATATTFVCPGTDFDPSSPDPNPWVGRKIVISWGWKAREPYRFKHLYRRDGFLPDNAEVGNAVVFPPTELKPGGWSSNDGPSTHYVTRDKWGFLLEDAQRPFAHGDAAIFLGDNWKDPTTTAADDGSPKPAYLEYWDRMWMGVPCYHSPVFQPKTAGVISSGTNFSFTDSSAQWWEITTNTNADGSSVLHAWTAAGGSSSTSVKITGLASSGFVTNSDYFNDLIIECQIDASTPNIWEARPIHTLTLAGGDGTFAIYGTVPPFTSSTAGRPVRIRQPGYVRNRWVDRKCTFTKPDGTTFTVRGKWSDDKSWYCPTQAFIFMPGWKYELEDREPGIVMHWVVEGEWRLSSDPGVVQDTRGADWRPYTDPTGRTMNLNLPKEHVPLARDDGGRYRLDDITDARLVKQLKNAIDALVWTPEDVTYETRDDPAVPENNEKNSQSIMSDVDSHAGICTNGKAVTGACWASSDPLCTFVSETAAAPYANSQLNFSGDSLNTAALNRRYIYAAVNLTCPGGLKRKVTIWLYSQLDVFDHDDGEVIVGFDEQDPPVQSNRSEFHFDAHGDGVLFRSWAEVASSAPTDAATVRVRVGSAALPAPNWTTCPPALGTTVSDPNYLQSTSYAGWVATRKKAIVKHNVRPGGMRYLDVID
jgi:hypothetical protein